VEGRELEREGGDNDDRYFLAPVVT